MFELQQTPATLVKFNPRSERHGQDLKPAGDIKFVANMESALLADFHPTLRSFLFCNNGSGHDLADATHEAPNLRMPKLAPVKWLSEYTGYVLRLHIGTSERSHMVMEDCVVNKFELAPQEGGTVVVTFTVQCHPDEKQAGKLSMLGQVKVDISVSPSDGSKEILQGAKDDGEPLPGEP